MARLRPAILAATLSLAVWLSGAARAADVAFTAHVLPDFAIGHPERTQFGKLEWIGGFEIEADNRDAGGFSGLVVSDHGQHLLSIADNALMLAASIRRDADGRPVGLADTRTRRLTAAGGSGRLPDPDTESIDILDGPGAPRAVISLEGRPRLYVGPLGSDGLVGLVSPLPLPPATATLRRSKGLESVAAVPASTGLPGTMLILAERAENNAATDNQPGWLIGGPRPVAFRIHSTNGYDLTDAKFGPDGRLYVLERLFSLSAGVWARLRRFDVAGLADGALLDGETLFEASLAHQIDNMEGLALWTDAAGATRVSMISDNNRLILQRTLYLEFRLKD